VLASISGWFLEAIFRSIRDRRLINPGLLHGPYLILYGSFAVIFGVFYGSIRVLPVVAKVGLYWIGTTLFELLSGFLAEKLFGRRLWDYSDLKYQFRGLISLRYSIYWIILSFCFELLLFPLYLRLESLLPEQERLVISSIFVMIMALEMMIYIRRHISQTKSDVDPNEGEFLEFANDILNHPEFARLAHYNHHRDKSRLNHVVEIAWYSYKIAKRFSCDTESTVRGALLHDFFHYDWLHEGPRLHGFFHPGIALKNARNHFSLNRIEADIIKKHMWPLTPIPPLHRESLIVCVVDTVLSSLDYLRVYDGSRTPHLLIQTVGSRFPSIE
jgi:uncharacterized protein